jgi:hypothetical protein
VRLFLQSYRKAVKDNKARQEELNVLLEILKADEVIH